MELTVNVTSYEAVYKYKTEDKTIGKIIETYREKKTTNPTEAESYFDLKQSIPRDFLKRLKLNSNSYDYVQVMLPIDERRKITLELFAQKMYDGNNNYSANFTKINNVSVVGVDSAEAANNFTFTKPELSSIPKRIHIIDDTISSGCTINIFLDNLKNAGLLTNDTVVTATIIYNNAGKTKPC